MKQLTLAAVGVERYAKTTRRAGVFSQTRGGAGVFCGVGGGGRVAGFVCVERAILSQAGQWPAADRGRADAAHLFPAAVVQSVGPGGGGGALRFVCDAPLCRY